MIPDVDMNGTTTNTDTDTHTIGVGMNSNLTSPHPASSLHSRQSSSYSTSSPTMIQTHYGVLPLSELRDDGVVVCKLPFSHTAHMYVNANQVADINVKKNKRDGSYDLEESKDEIFQPVKRQNSLPRQNDTPLTILNGGNNDDIKMDTTFSTPFQQQSDSQQQQHQQAAFVFAPHQPLVDSDVTQMNESFQLSNPLITPNINNTDNIDTLDNRSISSSSTSSLPKHHIDTMSSPCPSQWQ